MKILNIHDVWVEKKIHFLKVWLTYTTDMQIVKVDVDEYSI